jgi:hypothetical protein
MPGSGAPVGCGTRGPCLAPGDDCSPAAAEPLPVGSFAGGTLAPAPPLAPFDAAVVEGSEVSEAPGFELSDAVELELLDAAELSEDPPPQPANKSAATTSARIALALVVIADLARRR